MPKALTPIAIANLRSGTERYEASDGGCRGLKVVVFPTTGAKSFIVRYRFRGVQRKLTLGPCLTERGVQEPATPPEIGAPQTLASARQLATKALREVRAGHDPAAAKAKARAEALAAESDTLSAVAAEYLRREGPRLRTLNQRRSDLDLICASPLGRLPVAEIKRGQFTRVLDRIADGNGPVRSDRCLSALRTLLTWHARRSDFVSPLAPGGRRTSISERARTRVLTDDELRRVWAAAESGAGPFGPFIMFLLLTGVRRSEGAGLRLGELTDNGATWTIPAVRCKTKRDVVIPLSKAAQKIIAAQPVLGGGDHVFSVDGSRPLGGFDDRKKDFDQRAGISNYGLHDLRRTARTLLSRAGVAADIAEMCLGHALVGVRGTYDRFQYIDEKRRAFEALAAQIERIVRPPADVVVPMRARARSARRK
jgi:integrase